MSISNGKRIDTHRDNNKNGELERLQEVVKTLKAELANNNVIERWKIGKYLHDNLAQQLTSAKISINLLKKELTGENLTSACDEIIEIIDESINEVRELSHDIIPMEVKKKGLKQAFTYLKKQTERRHGVNCRLETDDILHKINRREIATNLFYITQEAIKNAVNHGKAKNIKIALIGKMQQLELHIKDDGKSFDTMDGDSGVGIRIMKHRAEKMGGTCRIKRSDGSSEYNTVVTCTLSLQALGSERN